MNTDLSISNSERALLGLPLLVRLNRLYPRSPEYGLYSHRVGLSPWYSIGIIDPDGSVHIYDWATRDQFEFLP
jgi:hypothetical protein